MKTTHQQSVLATEMKLRGTIDSIQFPVWAEPKIDGEYTWIVNLDRQAGPGPRNIYTVNKTGLLRWDFPALNQIQINEPFIFIAELYCGDGHSGDLYKLLASKGGDGTDLKLRVFDTIRYSNIDMTNVTLLNRLETLSHLGMPMYGEIIHNSKEVPEYFKQQVDLGYEGIVLKNLHEPLMLGPSRWVKIKQKDQSDFIVVNIDPVRETIDVAVTDNAGVARTVSCKCSNADKAYLKVGSLVTIEHQGVLSKGGLRHPVYKGKVK